MIVAVPLFQHSPMFGQMDSSQTVARRCSRTVARNRSKRSPLGNRAFSHEGFGSRGDCWRSARAFTPFLMAANPCSVWYFVPVVTTGMPRNSLIVLGNIEKCGNRVSHGEGTGCYGPVSRAAAAERQVHNARRGGAAQT